jgi:hypothetical protein
VKGGEAGAVPRLKGADEELHHQDQAEPQNRQENKVANLGFQEEGVGQQQK